MAGVRAAFGWVRRAAAVLANKKGLDAAGVRRRYRGLIAALARHREGRRAAWPRRSTTSAR